MMYYSRAAEITIAAGTSAIVLSIITDCSGPSDFSLTTRAVVPISTIFLRMKIGRSGRWFAELDG